MTGERLTIPARPPELPPAPPGEGWLSLLRLFGCWRTLLRRPCGGGGGGPADEKEEEDNDDGKSGAAAVADPTDEEEAAACESGKMKKLSLAVSFMTVPSARAKVLKASLAVPTNVDGLRFSGRRGCARSSLTHSAAVRTRTWRRSRVVLTKSVKPSGRAPPRWSR